MRRVTSAFLVVFSGACTPDSPASGEDPTDNGSTAATVGDPSGATMPTSTGSTTADAESSTSSTSPPSTTGEPDPTSAETTGASPTCTGAGVRCVPEAPEGWNGPVALLDDDEGPDVDSCGGMYPASVAAGPTVIDNPPAECDCECDDPAGGACSATISTSVYNVTCSTTCNTNYGSCAVLSDTLMGGLDTFVDSDDDGIRIRPSSPVVTQAPTCDAIPNHVVPELEVSSYFEICAYESPPEETCAAGEVCVPTPTVPYEPELCIWADGDQECPEASEYLERVLVYRDVTDTRSCSACTCDPAQEVACAGEVMVVGTYSDGELTQHMFDPIPADGSCSDRLDVSGTPLAGVTFSVDYDPELPTSTGCDPAGGTPMGDVIGNDPLTLCCTGG